MTRDVVVLLGRRPDLPPGTDAIEAYCVLLGEALVRQGWRTTLRHLHWDLIGWPRALRGLWHDSVEWRGQWVLVQYTALFWSVRGFPLPFLAVLGVLRLRGSRIGIVYHDPQGHSGTRARDRVRRWVQHGVMRAAYALADVTIHTVPVAAVPWLPANAAKAICIPVGSTVATGTGGVPPSREPGETKTVAVFCLRRGERSESEEAADIGYAVARVAPRVDRLQLVVFGRGSDTASDHVFSAIADSKVAVSVTGVLPADEINRQLLSADALLFVRGAVTGGRSSATAAIACGLPIVGYSGDQTGYPITEAGVLLVPPGDREALGEALARVLTDPALWVELHRRSRSAFEDHFSWDAIAARVAEAFGT